MWVQPFRADVEQVPGRVEGEQRVAVLLNANARKVTAKIVRAISHVVPQGDLYLSRSELDARRIAAQVVDRGYHTLFLGGGDGTLTCFVNEVMTQVALRRQHHPTRMPRFGVLKLGTGNSVAALVKASSTRDDGFVDDVLRARAGEVPGYRTIDLLLIDGKRAPFAGLGLDGKLLNDYNWVKRNLGQGGLMKKVMTGAGGYFASVAFKTVPYYLTHSTAVDCEVINGPSTAYLMGADGAPKQSYKPGETLYKGSLMMAAAGTVPYYGFELKMFPFAGKRRGMMDLRLGTVPTTAILANLPKLWSGTWFPEGIRDFLVKDATIKFSREMPFQISGDAEGYRSEVHFQVAPEPIDVVDFTGSLH
ncbi:MAG: diacylglycerol kinase family protein [Archangium sp.]